MGYWDWVTKLWTTTTLFSSNGKWACYDIFILPLICLNGWRAEATYCWLRHEQPREDYATHPSQSLSSLLFIYYGRYPRTIFWLGLVHHSCHCTQPESNFWGWDGNSLLGIASNPMKLHYELPVIAIFAQYDPIVFVSSMDSCVIIIVFPNPYHLLLQWPRIFFNLFFKR